MNSIFLPPLFAAVLSWSSASACAAEPPIAFRMWINPKAKVNHAYAKRASEHPCGEVVEIRANRLPPYKHGAYLQPERVFEIGAAGAVLRTWVMPVDAYVLGVEGEDLYFEVHNKTFAVTLDRRLRRIAQPPALAGPVEADCRVSSEIAPSNYAACLAFRDASSGGERKLVYEFACT